MDRNASPFLPVPAAVWAMALAVLGVEAALQLGAAGILGGAEAVGWRLGLIQRIGWSGALWQRMAAAQRFPPEELLRLVAYPLVHAEALAAVFTAVLVLALGKALAAALRGWAIAVLVLAGAAVGAMTHALLWPEPVWLIGGLPVAFALVGAFVALARAGLVAAVAAQRRRLLALVAVLLVLRVGVGLWLGVGQEWLADLGAFAAGLALARPLAPGGGGWLLGRLRRR